MEKNPWAPKKRLARGKGENKCNFPGVKKHHKQAHDGTGHQPSDRGGFVSPCYPKNPPRVGPGRFSTKTKRKREDTAATAAGGKQNENQDLGGRTVPSANWRETGKEKKRKGGKNKCAQTSWYPHFRTSQRREGSMEREKGPQIHFLYFPEKGGKKQMNFERICG